MNSNKQSNEQEEDHFKTDDSQIQYENNDNVSEDLESLYQKSSSQNSERAHTLGTLGEKFQNLGLDNSKQISKIKIKPHSDLKPKQKMVQSVIVSNIKIRKIKSPSQNPNTQQLD